MKISKIIQLMMLVACIPLTTAFANHNTPGENLIARLIQDAQQLNTMVQYSYLRYPVKAAVIRFAVEVNRLENCSSIPSFIAETLQPLHHDQIMDHIGPEDHNEGGSLAYQLQRVQQAWYPVERYLYDTYSDMPQVYQQYQQTRQALYALLGQGRYATAPAISDSAPLNNE